MKLLISSFILTLSLTAWATESDTPCPAMNQETREKIIDVKVKSSQSKSVTKQ